MGWAAVGGAGLLRGAELSLSRKLDEQHDSQTSQQIKEQEFVHFLPQPSLPALRKEVLGQKDLRTQAAKDQEPKSPNRKCEILTILSLGFLRFLHPYPCPQEEGCSST